MSNTESNFREYVDKFIGENTEYASVEELLEAKVKKPFFSGGKIRKLRKENIVKINYAVNVEDYISFLDYHLGIFPQMFGKWSPMILKSPNALRSALTGNNNQTWTEVPLGDPSLKNNFDEIHIGTQAHGKSQIIAKICITHENWDPKNENRNIGFDICPRVFAAPCSQKYALSVKAIPIMHAATKYYLEMYLPNKNDSSESA